MFYFLVLSVLHFCEQRACTLLCLIEGVLNYWGLENIFDGQLVRQALQLTMHAPLMVHLTMQSGVQQMHSKEKEKNYISSSWVMLTRSISPCSKSITSLTLLLHYLLLLQ